MRRVCLAWALALMAILPARVAQWISVHDQGKGLFDGGVFAGVDTALMGLKTFEAALKLGGGSFSSSMTSYVLSKSQPAGERQRAAFTRMAPERLIAEIRKEPSEDIWLIRGGDLVQSFLKADLVDELYIGVVPLLLGSRIPLFLGGFPQRSFELLQNKTYSQGMIALNYRRLRAEKNT